MPPVAGCPHWSGTPCAVGNAMLTTPRARAAALRAAHGRRALAPMLRTAAKPGPARPAPCRRAPARAAAPSIVRNGAALRLACRHVSNAAYVVPFFYFSAVGTTQTNARLPSGCCAAMSLRHTIHGLYKGVAEAVLPPRSATGGFRETGVLTPDEFVAAGDFLLATCPSWAWQARFAPCTAACTAKGVPHQAATLRPTLFASAYRRAASGQS